MLLITSTKQAPSSLVTFLTPHPDMLPIPFTTSPLLQPNTHSLKHTHRQTDRQTDTHTHTHSVHSIQHTVMLYCFPTILHQHRTQQTHSGRCYEQTNIHSITFPHSKKLNFTRLYGDQKTPYLAIICTHKLEHSLYQGSASF
jgi:hypothetical protein